MKLTLQTLTGTKYFLGVEPSDKVRKVKVKIYNDLEIKSKVRLLWQNKQIEDGVTLEAQGITEDTTLQMVIEPDNEIKLKIQSFKRGTISVAMKDSDTVLDLLEEVHSSALLPSARISDFYFRDICLSDDKLPVHFYGITDGCVISQHYQGSFTLKICDTWNLRTSTGLYITIRGTDSIKLLKEKVLETVNKGELETWGLEGQIDEDNIVIFHEKETFKKDGSCIVSYEELDRENLTISECKLKPLDKLFYILYHGKLGTEIGIGIKRGDMPRALEQMKALYPETVFSLQLKIQHQLHIPYEKQQLYFVGKTDPLEKSEEVTRDKLPQITVKVLQ